MRTRHNLIRGELYTLLKKYWPLALPLLLLLPGIFSFPYPSAQAEYSDLAISHYPNAVFLLRAIKTWHAIPLWSPSILSGYPFIANPLAGIWYLPGWLAYLFPLPFGFNLLVGLHLLWGGIGMYKLLQTEGRTHQAALFGALAFEAMPKLFAHYGAGHLTLLYAVPWTPWLLLAWRAPGLRLSFPRLTWRVPAGLMLSLIFLADVRWAAYAGLLWFGYALTSDYRDKNPIVKWKMIPRLKDFVWQLALAALLSAPLGLPLLEYSRLSTRSEMALQDIFTFSLPFSRLLGLIIPDFGGFQEFVLYPGLVVFLLATLAVLLGVVQTRAKFWLWAAGLAVLYALGDQIPLLSTIGRLPGFDMLRVPSRALFISGIAFIVLAAYTLDRLLSDLPDRSPEVNRARRNPRLILIALLAFVMFLSVGIWWLTGSLPFNFVWSCLILAGFWMWYEFLVGKRLAPHYTYIALIGICMIDLSVFDLKAFTPRSPADVLAEGRSVMQALPVSNLAYRVYSPSYSMPQQTAGYLGFELADGVDPLQLKSYVDFMRKATGIGWDGYSVTLPAFDAGDPHSVNAWARPDPVLLGLLNVRFIVAAYEQNAPGLSLRNRINGTWIYENQDALPRAWLQAANAPAGENASAVEAIDWSPNRVAISVNVPDSSIVDQRLVLSELFYPGWRVYVDGKPATLEPEAEILRSVIVPPGPHEIVFKFQPVSLYLGLIASALAWLWALLSGFQ